MNTGSGIRPGGTAPGAPTRVPRGSVDCSARVPDVSVQTPRASRAEDKTILSPSALRSAMTGFEKLLAGHLLSDRYRVETVIGRGGMGAVYCATDIRLERPVAVKVVTVVVPDAESRIRVRARFHREARAAARLQHPNVVTVHDFGTDTRLDLDFLVMELLRGEDLSMRLARGRLPLGQALRVLHAAACGLAAGHRVGLVHRDVKPGNIFIEQTTHGDERICILDFGIVQVAADDEGTVTQLTALGRGPHSPAYASPEQLAGERGLTPACDVFSLGVTAFQLLTGEKPFSEEDLRRLAMGLSVPAPSARTRNADVSPELDRLIRTALSARPGDRFRDAGEFARALDEVRRGGHFEMDRSARPETVAFTARPADDDRTLLAAEPARPNPRYAEATQAAPTRAAEPHAGTVLSPPWAPTPPRRTHETARPPAAQHATREPAESADKGRPGVMRRIGAVLWELGVTTLVLCLAVALWAGMNEAYRDDLREPFYAAVAGLTAVVPWLTHRVFGRRSSYLLALIGAAAVAVAAFRFIEPLVGTEGTLIALPVGQLTVSTWLTRLTRRRPKPDPLAIDLSQF